MKPFLIFLAVLVAAFRLLIVVTVSFSTPVQFTPLGVNIFKDLAHLYVGMNYGAWFVSWQIELAMPWHDDAKLFKWIALLLTAWEVACFAAGAYLKS